MKSKMDDHCREDISGPNGGHTYSESFGTSVTWIYQRKAASHTTGWTSRPQATTGHTSHRSTHLLQTTKQTVATIFVTGRTIKLCGGCLIKWTFNLKEWKIEKCLNNPAWTFRCLNESSPRVKYKSQIITKSVTLLLKGWEPFRHTHTHTMPSVACTIANSKVVH